MRSILQGTALVLIILVSIAFFLTLVAQLNDVGTGDYGFMQMLYFLFLKIPGQIVNSIAISVLIGTILSLGSLANNNEIVVVQSSGLSILSLLSILLKAALIVAVFTIVLQQWLVPLSEPAARNYRQAAMQGLDFLNKSEGVWFKDGYRVVHIKKLALDGYAQGIQIFELNEKGEMQKATSAEFAESKGKKWILNKVKISFINTEKVTVEALEQLVYDGDLSTSLLKSLRVDQELMSLTDLYKYQKFLGNNGLDNYSEKIILWRKIYSPFAILVMCSLALPFILGSQRGGQAGRRVMLGVILGLSFAVFDRFLVRMGEYFLIYPEINTLLPTLIFMLGNIVLLYRLEKNKD
ncbi:MAG: LPS export ABC transporter permease LptG [Gammaproteobacteria bacterium]|nr:LPS export ABC transporter permease LptG [Gammaproteobacteria bacterium]